MPDKVTNLPDIDHVVRHVPWARLRKDEDDNVIGILPQAFQRRPGEESLSVTWLEYFTDPSTATRDAIWAIRRSRAVGGKSAFGIGNVRRIKETCVAYDARVRIVHEPKTNEPAHSTIRRLPRDDMTLLAALAEDVFARMVKNVDVPREQ